MQCTKINTLYKAVHDKHFPAFWNLHNAMSLKFSFILQFSTESMAFKAVSLCVLVDLREARMETFRHCLS